MLAATVVGCVAALALLLAPGLVERAAAATITATAGQGGTITPSGLVEVPDGTDQTFTIAPGLGFEIADVVVDGASQGPLPSYAFIAVAGDHTIAASFAATLLQLTYAAGPGGSIQGPASQTVPYGGAGATVTAVPGTGYHFVAWSDGLTTPTRTDSGITAALSVTAGFAIDVFTLTPVLLSGPAGVNGVISPMTPQIVAYGGSSTFTITAAAGYYVADVLVDGVSVGPLRSYTFFEVAGSHTIAAVFSVGVQTRVALSARARTVDIGRTVVLNGVLYDARDPRNEVPMGGRTLVLQSGPSPNGPWSDVAARTTGAGTGSVGSASWDVKPSKPAYYRLRFTIGADSGYGSSISFVLRVGVRPLVGTPRAPAKARAGRAFTLSGSLRPDFPARQRVGQVTVYRIGKGRLRVVRTVVARTVDRKGTTVYRASIKLGAGRYRFRMTSLPTASWDSDVSSLSRVLIVR